MACLSSYPMAQFCFYSVGKQVKSAVKQHFSAVEPCVVYQQASLCSNKNVLPALQKSNVIYQFSCHCDSWNVGRTSQRLQDRAKQHIPKSIHSCSSQKCLLSIKWGYLNIAGKLGQIRVKKFQHKPAYRYSLFNHYLLSI